MPIKFVLKFVVAPLLLLTVTTAIAVYTVRSEPAREPASIKIQKLGADQLSAEFFDVKITDSNTSTTEDAGSSYTVTISALRSVPAGLSFTWAVPSDSRLVAGDLTGTLYALQAGESQQIKIDLAGFSKQQKKFLGFQITGQIFNQPVKRDLLIASQLENTIEYKIQQAYQRDNSLQNKLGTKSSKFKAENVIK
jgi:hypothetical protein